MITEEGERERGVVRERDCKSFPKILYNLPFVLVFLLTIMQVSFAIQFTVLLLLLPRKELLLLRFCNVLLLLTSLL